MKRLIIAVLLTVAVILACVFGAFYVTAVCRKSVTLLGKAEDTLANRGNEDAEMLARKTADYWNDHRKLLFFFVNRKAVDDITEQLTLLSETENVSDFAANLHLIVFRIDRLTDDWTFRIEHIF